MVCRGYKCRLPEPEEVFLWVKLYVNTSEASEALRTEGTVSRNGSQCRQNNSLQATNARKGLGTRLRKWYNVT